MIIVKWYVKLAFNVVFVMFLNKHINSLPSHHPQKHLHHYLCILLLPPFRVSRSGLRPKSSRFLPFLMPNTPFPSRPDSLAHFDSILHIRLLFLTSIGIDFVLKHSSAPRTEWNTINPYPFDLFVTRS